MSIGKDLICPYCGHKQNINHDDGHGYAEDKVHRETCEACDKVFGFTTYVSYSYTEVETPCLNTEEDTHDWEYTGTYPKKYCKMRCSMCDEERQMTEEEANKLKEQYPDKWDFDWNGILTGLV